MEHVDPMLQSAWEENLKLQATVERYRDDLCDARKCIADIKAILADEGDDHHNVTAVLERLVEYYEGM